jgi:uncharacterized membrane protein affecting hemolysin expression
MTNNPNEEDNLFCTLELTKKQARWVVTILTVATLIVLSIWVVVSEQSMKAQQTEQFDQLKSELEECRAEATAWYNSSTALSDAIVTEALRGGLAEQVNTDIALAFAIKGHELKCIEPKFPTG